MRADRKWVNEADLTWSCLYFYEPESHHDTQLGYSTGILDWNTRLEYRSVLYCSVCKGRGGFWVVFLVAWSLFLLVRSL